jgi:hypothetical protein
MNITNIKKLIKNKIMKTYVGYYRKDISIYAFPTHRSENDNTNYLYIKVEVIK